MEAYVHAMAAQLTDVLICSNVTDVTQLLLLVAGNNCRLKFISVNAANSNGEEAPWTSLIGTVLTQSAETPTSLSMFSTRDRRLQIDSELSFPALRQLRVTILCDEDLTRMCSAATNLQHIHLLTTRCTHVGFAAIGRYCRDLTSFHIQTSLSGFVDNIDAGFTAIAAGCSKLQRLYLDKCHNLSDVGMLAVAAQCKQLTELTIICSKHITGASLIALAESAGACLRYVSLDHCARMTGVGIGALGKCSAQRTLKVIGCEPFSSADLIAAITHLQNIINFKCDHLCIDDGVLCAIAEHMPQLERLNLDINIMYVGTRVVYTSTGLLQVALKCEELKIMEVSVEGPILTDMERGLWKRLRPELQILPEHQYARAVCYESDSDDE